MVFALCVLRAAETEQKPEVRALKQFNAELVTEPEFYGQLSKEDAQELYNRTMNERQQVED